MARRITPEGYGTPNVASYTAQNDDRGQIIIALTIAFVVQFFGHLGKAAKNPDTGKTGKRTQAEWFAGVTGLNLIGWVVLIVMLSIMADFQTMQPVAVSFAWLILLAAVLLNGVDAADNIAGLWTPKVKGK